MPWKDKEHKHRADLKRQRDRKKQLILLMGGKCIDCGIEGHPAIYDFDHIDPSTKSFGIAARSQAPIEQVLAELEKCELVCANCHRIRTAKYQKGTYHDR